MAYDDHQALSVALFNAGVRSEAGGMPTQLAREVVDRLAQMGWRLDGTVHEVDLAAGAGLLKHLGVVPDED